jgi:hypothetical protein
VGSLRRELERLRRQARPKRPTSSEAAELEKGYWLARRRVDRSWSTPEAVRHARSLIRLFRVQNILSEMSADELVERIVSWRPVPDGGWLRSTAEREVGLAIYNQEPGTENMVCSSRWRESFEAGDELREKYDAIPDAVLAEAYVRLGRVEEGDEEALAEWSARYEEAFGITDELVRKAIGLDVEEISDEERNRRLHEYLADTFYGERGWRIHQLMRRFVEEP